MKSHAVESNLCPYCLQLQVYLDTISLYQLLTFTIDANAFLTDLCLLVSVWLVA